MRAQPKRFRVQYVAWKRDGSIWRDTRMYLDTHKTENGARRFCVRTVELESRYRFGYACRIEVTSVAELTDEEFTRQRDADTNEVFRQLWANRRPKEIRAGLTVLRHRQPKQHS